jgi:two-component system NtrC family sensor kinase
MLPYSSIFVLPGVLIYAYAISNFKLFSFQTALDQFRLFPITYKIAVSIATIAIVSFAVFQIPIVWWAFQDGQTFEAWRRYLVFSVISALVPNLLLLLLVVRTISRPLERIALAAVRVTKGEYGTEVDLRKSNDEIGLLADSFNEMSRKMRVDIDQLKSMNEQLMRSDRLAAMGTLAAGVAHEVNNPLAAISSLIQIIQKQYGNDPETSEQLILISEQIARIKRVTKDLTDFARVRPAAKAMIDVNDVVRSSLRLANFDAGFQKLKAETKLDETVTPILADADQLQQVFLNLLLNAKDAMPGGGSLLIETIAEESAIVVRIADTGTGIDELTAKQIFDPFFTTKPAGQGTGLGLAVCYGIVTAHGGTIEVKTHDSGGTTFDLRFPYILSSSPG